MNAKSETKAAAKTAEVKAVETVAPVAEKAAAPVAEVKAAEPAAAKKAVAKKPATAKKTAAKTTVKKEAAPAAEKKTAVKKAAAPKKAAETTEAAPKKPRGRKPAVKEAVSSVYIEYAGKQVVAKDVLEAAKKAYSEINKDAVIKTIEVYVKPEENAAYYVVNGEGSDQYKVLL